MKVSPPLGRSILFGDGESQGPSLSLTLGTTERLSFILSYKVSCVGNLVPWEVAGIKAGSSERPSGH